jgi:hypothetical protein
MSEGLAHGALKPPSFQAVGQRAALKTIARLGIVANLLALGVLVALWPLLTGAMIAAALLLLVHDAAETLRTRLLSIRRLGLPRGIARPVLPPDQAPTDPALTMPSLPAMQGGQIVLRPLELFTPGTALLTDFGRLRLQAILRGLHGPVRRIDVVGRTPDICEEIGGSEPKAAMALASAQAAAVAAVIRAEKVVSAVGVFGASGSEPEVAASPSGIVELIVRRPRGGLRDVA